PSRLHLAGSARAGAPPGDQRHRADPLLRRLLGLGLPRGRRSERAEGVRAVRGRPAMTASALYEGTVRHRRMAVRTREFRYGIHMAYVDLDELPGLLGGKLASPRPGIVRFRRSDYFGDPREDLGSAVRDQVAELTGTRPEGPVRLLTNLRAFGHCFNPVSFYYCFDSAGERVEAVMADVTNTPWGERHAYALSGQNGSHVLTGRSDKQLHVSPFMGMDHQYQWNVGVPGDRLSVHIESHRNG